MLGTASAAQVFAMSSADSITASVYPTAASITTTGGEAAIPLLESGDHLTREEFERRYNAMPHIKKAELIEGIVYMASPVRLKQHGEPHMHLGGWLVYYISKTYDLRSGDNSSSRLDERNVPQPDLMLLLPERLGSTARVDDEGYVAGAPDLVVEVAASSVSIDLHDKMEAYRRNGVREYLVYRTQEQAVEWFKLKEDKYEAQVPDERGLLCSSLFPGLWLDPAALVAGDLPKLLAAVDEGAKSEAHAKFVEQLKEAAEG